MPANAAYVPDDAQITLAALEYLRTAEGLRLRQAIAELPRGGTQPTVAQIAGLRKHFPAGPTHAALALARLQPKAAGVQGKFPEMEYVWATPEALEQATHAQVARHKAARFAQWGARHIYDLCAGIGGDALAFAEFAPVTAIEVSPVRAACLRFNAEDRRPPFPLTVHTADIRSFIDTLPADGWIHIDPARRSAGKRSVRYEDLIPGPEVLQRLFAHVRRGGGAIKLSPAVDFDSLPTGHVELISHDGSVVQALLWIDTDQAPGQRTATVLASGQPPWSLTAIPRPVAVASLPVEAYAPLAERPIYLYEVDGAVTRAGLAQVFAEPRQLQPLTVDGGYLLSTPGAALLKEAALTAFHVQVIVPFARVTAALAKCAAAPGVIEVKTRGRLPGIDTDQLQHEWTKAHPVACTVLLFRHERETWAALARRV